jgi:superfamily II DNA or RNA helicase
MSESAEFVEQFLLDVLDSIEQQEARLLVWGLVDGRLSGKELDALIDPLLDNALEKGLTSFISSPDVVKALKSRALLFETDSIPYPGFRSRMAETIRLLFRLRQLFPKHASLDGWQRARTLVADFRFLWRRRRYPARDTTISKALDAIAKTLNDIATSAALRALLQDRGELFNLAAFQLRAVLRIVSHLEAKTTSGTLVSAGTGSGKTLAFYLPALARIASHIIQEKKTEQWVKILALYPRTELLRDQFAEIYREARRLDYLLSQRGRRKIRIGTLFGGTPNRARSLINGSVTGWRKIGRGYVCGFMGCPRDNCGGDLIWENQSVEQEREVLVCAKCDARVGEDEVVLTRNRLSAEPPDILFTTTEMLNQRMADSRIRHLFGLPPQAKRSPELVLLDEVHTYAGLHGAQVAYLLRRWTHMVRAPVSFVGLSATLRDGARFFSRLTGLFETQVEEIAPRYREMRDEGAEYLLALRGDPVSRASLLSTTIQTNMLVARALDNPASNSSGGLYGTRTFAFSDDIDSTNRLYFGLLDAEGRDARGNPNMVHHPNGGLAVLRRPLPSTARELFGQNWNMPELIGHRLDDRKSIGRTSSQDPGVSAGMDVIVATASLEVGFNDSAVGAIIQHKAPRGVAQFLQRKGRAGRSRKMRPWTIVVLSDYGRDRLAYQSYDELFDPELMVQAIPLSSRYIQRIQATYSLIDYLGKDRGGDGAYGNAWQDLSGPAEDPEKSKQRRAYIVKRLATLLQESDALDALSEHVERSLKLSESDIEPLLWDYPRPLLTAVIPTALRRVSTNWRRRTDKAGDFSLPNSPLPEFVPASLFRDLNLPEIKIIIPPWRNDQPKPEAMPVAQAVRTFAPGRVSRRFGTRDGSIRHWVTPTLNNTPEHEVEIDQFYDVTPLGGWQVLENNQVVTWPVFRPIEIRPVHPPRNVRDTSNARLAWRSQIVTTRRGFFQRPPTSSPWRLLIDGMEAFLHSEHSPVEVRRFAMASDADIQFDKQDELRTRFCYRRGGEPVALGFSMAVDAVRFRMLLPLELWKGQNEPSAAKWRALRTARFFDLAWSGEELRSVANPFARQWLATIYFAAISHDALTRNISLADADRALSDGTASIHISEVLSTLFQSPAAPDENDDAGTDLLRQELDTLLREQVVTRDLRRLGQILWEPIDASWEPWLQSRFKATVAAAILESIRNLCPDIAEDDLVVDIEPGPRAPGDAIGNEDANAEIWVCEVTPGGTGNVETFLRNYAEDPRRFYALLSSALRPTDYELVDHQLARFLDLVVGPQPSTDLTKTLQTFRSAGSLQESRLAFTELRQQLSNVGFILFHGFITALGNRLLRPGATTDGDIFLRDAILDWQREEERVGVELDSSAVAHQLSQNGSIDRVMAAAGLPPPRDNLPAWRFNVIYGLLWPRGGAMRRSRLELYNPFATLPEAERLIVVEHLPDAANRIGLDVGGWQEKLLNGLAASGAITLVCRVDERRRLAEALTFLATNPVESDYLAVFARIDGLRRVRDVYEADIEIAEATQ